MRRLTLIIVLLAILSIALHANPNTTTTEDEIKIVLLPAANHQVRALVSMDRESILFLDTFELPKSSVQSGDVRSFFLHKDMVIETISLNGLELALYKTINVQASSFEPRMRLQPLVDINMMSQVYSFEFPKLDAYPETLEIKINYYLPFTNFKEVQGEPSQLITLRGENYWYPRSITEGSTVKVQVSTPQNFEVLVNEIVIGAEVQNRRKTHLITFEDRSTAPASITFIRKQLN